MISFTTEKEILSKPFVLIPSEWTLSSYKEIFSDTLLRTGLISSMIVTYFGVFLNVALTLLAAYAFSKPKFPGRKALYYVFIFTMFFSGGMIPSYLLIKDLGLIDSILSLILPTTLSIFSMILVKTYVEGLPKELRESAEIDGANEFVIFFKIILPLCGPVIATVSLFYAVDRWNDWFNAMLYINTDSMYPIQLVLRNIVNSATSKDIEQATGNIRVYGEGIKMATIIVVMGPIMIVYPFLQKYFMKGVMVGAIKG
jgi:putative aldouronate transport system permease protein